MQEKRGRKIEKVFVCVRQKVERGKIEVDARKER